MLSLTHIHLRVQDPEDAAQWYLNNLEASIIERYQTSAGGPSVAIDIGGTRINIMGNPPGEELPAANPDPHMGLEHFGLRTDDLEVSWQTPSPRCRGIGAYPGGSQRHNLLHKGP